MKSGNRDLVDRLAAEYVLGTLRGRARRHFERWLVSPQVNQMVKSWEGRLAALEPRPERVMPPPAVWRGIETRLDLRKLAGMPATRWLAIAASLVFFAIIGLLMVYKPGGVTPEPKATQYAVIQEQAGPIYWRVELLGENQEIAVHVQNAHALAAGKSLELWILPEKGNPVSLGLLPTTGEEHRVLTAAQRSALAGAKNLAVSLEPSGGSPTGLPTGPVLHVAPLSPA